jgi:hypothetical protein
MRAKMLSIPTVAAADAKSAQTLAEAKQVLKEKIHDALAELSEVQVQVINPLRSHDAEDGDGKGVQDGDPAA